MKAAYFSDVWPGSLLIPSNQVYALPRMPDAFYVTRGISPSGIEHPYARLLPSEDQERFIAPWTGTLDQLAFSPKEMLVFLYHTLALLWWIFMKHKEPEPTHLCGVKHTKPVSLRM